MSLARSGSFTDVDRANTGATTRGSTSRSLNVTRAHRNTHSRSNLRHGSSGSSSSRSSRATTGTCRNHRRTWSGCGHSAPCNTRGTRRNNSSRRTNSSSRTSASCSNDRVSRSSWASSAMSGTTGGWTAVSRGAAGAADRANETQSVSSCRRGCGNVGSGKARRVARWTVRAGASRSVSASDSSSGSRSYSRDMSPNRSRSTSRSATSVGGRKGRHVSTVVGQMRAATNRSCYGSNGSTSGGCSGS